MKSIQLAIFSVGILVILSACTAGDQQTAAVTQETTHSSQPELAGQTRIDKMEKELSRLTAEASYKQDNYLIWKDKIEELKIEIAIEKIALLPPEQAALQIATKWLTLFEITQRFYLYETTENDCNNLERAADRKACRIGAFTVNFGFLTGLKQLEDISPKANGVIRSTNAIQSRNNDPNENQYDFYNHHRDPNSMSVNEFVSNLVGIPLANTKFLKSFDFKTIGDLLCWESAVLFKGPDNPGVEMDDCPLHQHVAEISDIFGKPLSREVQAIKKTSSIVDFPEGDYVVIEFLTDFENKQAIKETIIAKKEIDTDVQWERFGKGKNTSKIHLLTFPPRQDGAWRVYSHQLD